MEQEKLWIKKMKKNASSESANMLIAKYYKEIYAFIYKQTLDGEFSLDLTQEIFISVLKSIHHYDERRASFRTWLYRVASNRLVDYYRSKHYKYVKLTEPIDGHDVKDDRDLAISLEYKEDVERVTSIINLLGTGLQQVVRLKLFGDYTLEEIAAIEQIPLSTVKTRYYSAIKIIKHEMKVLPFG